VDRRAVRELSVATAVRRSGADGDWGGGAARVARQAGTYADGGGPLGQSLWRTRDGDATQPPEGITRQSHTREASVRLIHPVTAMALLSGILGCRSAESFAPGGVRQVAVRGLERPVPLAAAQPVSDPAGALLRAVAHPR